MHVRRWRVLLSVILTCAIAVFVILNLRQIRADFVLLLNAQPGWIGLAFGIILLSYLVSSQVFVRTLSSLGYRTNPLRMWATALVAIIISQSIPAGGVGSYAFLVQSFRRANIATGSAALVASLEVMSYVSAMLLVFCFSLIFLTVRVGTGQELGASLVAGAIAMLLVGLAGYVLSRDTRVWGTWLTYLKNALAFVIRRPIGDEPVQQLVHELQNARGLVVEQRGMLALLVVIQLAALIGHSLAMLLVLQALGASVSILMVIAAFGIALITSSFNVLPGGGGTVETALAWVLTASGAGQAAIPAAVIFRLLNFWLLLPIAALCYRWLMHHQVAPAKT